MKLNQVSRKGKIKVGAGGMKNPAGASLFDSCRLFSGVLTTTQST